MLSVDAAVAGFSSVVGVVDVIDGALGSSSFETAMDSCSFV